MSVSRNAAVAAFGRDWLKPLTLVALLAPFFWIAGQWLFAIQGWPNRLGFNPAETTHRFLGETALRLLLLSLAVTHFRDITGWAPIMRVRRRIGLAAFFYALLHMLAYLGLDLFIAAGMSLKGVFAGLVDDVAERLYITLGMAALLLLLPLAATSNNAMTRRLGGRRWRRLHSLVYPIAILAVLHHYFMEKGAQPGPLIHGAILAILLGWRGWRRFSTGSRIGRSAAVEGSASPRRVERPNRRLQAGS